MIFLTVGTHEQQFDRLITMVDELDGDKFIQYGFSAKPKNSNHKQFIPFAEVEAFTQKASTVIVQGGAGSILTALDFGRVPVAVPRYYEFDEHVDDHQVEIVEKMAKQGLIVPLYKGEDLQECIAQSIELEKNKQTNLKKGANKLSNLINEYIAEN